MKPGFLLFLALLLAFPAAPARADTPGPTHDLPAGFFLLHQVCHQESQVAMLNILKTTPPEVADFVKRISALAKENEATLDRMADHNPVLRDAPDPLPPFEQATRESIQDDKQHLLLFGSKGTTYARRLVFTQIEAASYILNLAKVWADRDPDAGHDEAMRKMAASWTKIREEGFRLLDEGG